MKLSYFDNDTQRSIEDEVEAMGESIGLPTYEAGESVVPEEADCYGICKECRYFKFVQYEFHDNHAECGAFERVLTGKQRITKCNQFDKRGKLSLDQMIDIAWIIDICAPRAGLLAKQRGRRK